MEVVKGIGPQAGGCGGWRSLREFSLRSEVRGGISRLGVKRRRGRNAAESNLQRDAAGEEALGITRRKRVWEMGDLTAETRWLFPQDGRLVSSPRSEEGL